jgi:hypothetical protein
MLIKSGPLHLFIIDFCGYLPTFLGYSPLSIGNDPAFKRNTFNFDIVK